MNVLPTTADSGSDYKCDRVGSRWDLCKVHDSLMLFVPPARHSGCSRSTTGIRGHRESGGDDISTVDVTADQGRLTVATKIAGTLMRECITAFFCIICSDSMCTDIVILQYCIV